MEGSEEIWPEERPPYLTVPIPPVTWDWSSAKILLCPKSASFSVVVLIGGGGSDGGGGKNDSQWRGF
jgi:hypothetical protein